jgi:hypothetical protein
MTLRTFSKDAPHVAPQWFINYLIRFVCVIRWFLAGAVDVAVACGITAMGGRGSRRRLPPHAYICVLHYRILSKGAFNER